MTKRKDAPPGKMGRPSPWGTHALEVVHTSMPPHVRAAWRFPAFKADVDALAVQFLAERERGD